MSAQCLTGSWQGSGSRCLRGSKEAGGLLVWGPSRNSHVDGLLDMHIHVLLFRQLPAGLLRNRMQSLCMPAGAASTRRS